eukprot:8487787-Alexandrium_andersonii.AAC.1
MTGGLSDTALPVRMRGPLDSSHRLKQCGLAPPLDPFERRLDQAPPPPQSSDFLGVASGIQSE